MTGGCHCGNVRLSVTLSGTPETYSPRACDCDFCCKHRASYLSDPHGSLQFSVRDEHKLGRYQQTPGGAATFLHCVQCGVLVGVVHESFGAVNSAVVEDVTFGPAVVVSPKHLTPEERLQRWKSVWFPNVSIQTSGPEF